MNKELRNIINKRSMKLLESYGIYTLEEFYEKCKLKYWWGEFSNFLCVKDRISLKTLLLQDTIVDCYAYYPRKGHSPIDYIVRYEYTSKNNGNLIITSPNTYTIEERIVIDRIKRTIEIESLNSNYEITRTKKKLFYHQSEEFFYQLERGDVYETIYGFVESSNTEEITLTYLSGKEKVDGAHIMWNQPKVMDDLLSSIGLKK